MIEESNLDKNMINAPKITFLNKPKLKLTQNPTDIEFDKTRVDLIPNIEKYINDNPLFKNESVKISFFHTGLSSLVSLLETEETKYVLKIPLREDGPKGEALFLKAWEKAGVSVPHVYETGLIVGHSYVLMQYIEAEPLNNIYTEEELIEKKKFYEMGQILRRIHTVQAKGYGRLTKDEVSEFADFKTWLSEYWQTKNQLKYIKEQNVLPAETCGSIEKALEILLKHVESKPNSVYCHYDFAPSNILNTEPLTIFDPLPTFNDPYLDLGRSIAKCVAEFTSPEVSQQLIDGYFIDGDEPLDMQALQASVLFNSYTILTAWHKTNRTRNIENVKKYLAEHKKLLE